MTIQIDQVESLLTSRGYRVIHETSKKRGFQRAGELPIYLNLNSKTGETALVAHPESGVEALRHRRPDLRVGGEYFHSSNMRQFPKRMHTGAHPICYGWGLTFDSLLAVEACLDHLEGKKARVPTAVPATPAGVASPTEPRDEVSAPETSPGSELPVTAMRRVGHEQFRDALLTYWGGCAVTGLTMARLLRASHIKPWAGALPEEKTDSYNGLLLAPHIDAAFDAGLITFSDDGQMVLSPALRREDATLLGLHTGLRLRRLDVRHQPYLAFHRQEIFAR